MVCVGVSKAKGVGAEAAAQEGRVRFNRAEAAKLNAGCAFGREGRVEVVEAGSAT